MNISMQQRNHIDPNVLLDIPDSWAVGVESRVIQNSVPNLRDSYYTQTITYLEIFKNRIQRKFEHYCSNWEKETLFLSSMSDIEANANYQSIIAMGQDAIPLILKALIQKPNFWFGALAEITKADPIKKEHYGDLYKMTEDWIEWGRKNSYL